MIKIVALVSLLLLSAPARAQETAMSAVTADVIRIESLGNAVFEDVPGCVNGVIADPAAYFYAQINRQPGTPAPDWPQVIAAFAARGVGKNLPAGEPIPADAPHYGLRLMFDAGDNPRGRVWVPTRQPIDGQWFGEEHQYIADNPAWAVPCWQDTRACLWAPWQAGAAYAPRACSGGPVEPAPTPTPVPPTDTAVAALAARLEALQARVLALEDKPLPVPPALSLDDLREALTKIDIQCQVRNSMFHGHGCGIVIGGIAR